MALERGYALLHSAEDGKQLHGDERHDLNVRSDSMESIDREVHSDAPSCLPRGSLVTSVWVLMSVSLGMGVFVQPKVVARMGYMLGTGIIFLFALITNYSQILLLKVINLEYEHSGKKYTSFSEVSKDLLGQAGLIANCLTMTLTCLVANAGHLATATQMLHDIICWYFTGTYNYPFHAGQRFVILWLLCGFILPFCISSSDLHSLRYISTTSVTVCMILAVSVMFLAIQRLINHGVADGAAYVPAFHGDFSDTLSGAAAICFAYSSVINVVSINRDIQESKRTKAVEEINNYSKKSMLSVSLASSVCCVFYASLSLLCVLAWGNLCANNNGNILYLFPANDYWITFWCFALVIAVTLLYPIINVPMVNNLETLVMIVVNEPPRKATGCTAFAIRNRRAIISMIGMAVVIFLDTLVTDLADIFGLCGSLGLGMVSMILPALLALKNRHRLPTRDWFGASFVLIIGLVVTFGSSTSIIMDLIAHSGK